jgi:tetratricopeptide (TPR) repeat protein
MEFLENAVGRSSHESRRLDDEELTLTLSRLGCEHLIHSDANAAIDLFTAAARLSSPSASVLTNLGNALFMAHRLTDAEVAYQQAIEIDSGNPDALRNLGVVYSVQGRLDDAIDASLRYLALEPRDGESLYNLGLLYLQQEKEEEAAAAFEAAECYLSLDDAETVTKIGVGRFLVGEHSSSEELFRKALSLDPDYLPAKYHLGVCCLCDGQCDDAIAALEEVVAADPDYPQALENLGVAYNTAGRPEDAKRILQSLLDDEDDISPSLLLNLGIAHADTGDSERAGQCLRKVLEHEDCSEQLLQQARHLLDSTSLLRQEMSDADAHQ